MSKRGYGYEKFNVWRAKAIDTHDISPLHFGMGQEEMVALFGEPESTSVMTRNGKPLIYKYRDIEFHFDALQGHTLFLVYSDGELDLCIRDER